jgi:uncharacterized protein (TIGR02453 family)
MLQENLLQFLYELSQNNNRDWFEKNKPRYQKEVKKPFEAFVDAVIDELKTFEPDFNIQAKDCVFRIHRDTRFSKDKTPYKTHLAAVFTQGGRKTMHQPGYYLHLEFGSLQLGGGAYFMEKDALEKARTRIMADPKAFHAILEDSEFKKRFGELKGEQNKIVPKPFKEAAKEEPLLLYKQFYFMNELNPQLVLKPDAPSLIGQYYRAALPFNRFFREAIGG